MTEEGIQGQFNTDFMPDSTEDVPELYIQRHKGLIRRAFGNQPTADAPLITARYYADLLVWAVDCVIRKEGWSIVWCEPYKAPSPLYLDVDDGTDTKKNLLHQRVLLLQQNDELLLVTVHANPYEVSMVITTGLANMKTLAESFADKIEKTMHDRNFYRNRNIEMGYRITFLNVPHTSWDDVVLDQETKDTLRQHTIGFLSNRDRLKAYNMPIKRGVLIIGSPGSGKSKSLRALLSEASGITCITTIPALFRMDIYLHWLFQLAQDLSPSIVFIEDLDFLAQDRRYGRESSLLTLLNEMDGLQANEGVCVVCTANQREVLDKAAQRPSRIDIVINISKPTLKQRATFLENLAKDIPLDSCTQEYIARKTDGFTLCQVQEVVFSLAIQYCCNNAGEKPASLTFTSHQLDIAISKASRDSKQPHIGFNAPAMNGMQYDAPVHTGNEIKN